MIIEKIRHITKNDTGKLLLVITGVNAGNYLLNLLLGRFLGPVDFAEASLLATAVLILSFVAVGIQMTVAKFTAQHDEGKDDLSSGPFASQAVTASLVLGVLLAAVLLVAIPPVQAFLKFNSPLPLALIAFCIPVYFALSACRGVAQGKIQIDAFSRSFVYEMAGRFGGTAVLCLLANKVNPDFYSEAIAMGFVVSFFTGLIPVRIKRQRWFNPLLGAGLEKPVMVFFMVTIFYELTQILISYSDIVLVKHFFSNYEAGLYGALSLAGRMVYFATWAVVMLLVPKVVKLEKQGKPHNHLFSRSFMLITGAGGILTLGCAVFAGPLVSLLFGQAFIEIAPLFWKYSLATTLFASANVFVYYHLSLGRYLPVAMSAIAGVVQASLIMAYPINIEFIIHIQITVMTSFLTGVILFHISNRKTPLNPEPEIQYSI